ncbi:MAG TPA: N-acetylneuraminate lyase [Bacteroides sp.]|nr:N-acetylneuraminate lyase [Bacteroides sp.]
MDKIKGFISAPFTPMHEDGSVNLPKIKEFADFYVRNGVDGAFICGTSGEGFLLSLDERKKVAEKWVESSPPDFKPIIHVGGPGVNDCKLLAKHASEIGAYGIGTIAPVFFKPARVKELVDYCAALASAAPELPFYFYHMPGYTGVALSMVEFLEQSYDRIPNLAGIKYTHENLYEFNQCMLVRDGHYDMLHGQDETLLAGLALGATGGVGGTYNHMMGTYIELKAAFDAGDFKTAQNLQARSQAFINVLVRYRGNVVGGKRIMKFLGLDLGPNRIPIQNITHEEETQLKADLEEIGFFEYCNK